MPQIIGINTAHEIWIALEQNFLATSKARIMQFKLQLQTAKKKKKNDNQSWNICSKSRRLLIISLQLRNLLSKKIKFYIFLEVWDMNTIHLLCLLLLEQIHPILMISIVSCWLMKVAWSNKLQYIRSLSFKQIWQMT